MGIQERIGKVAVKTAAYFDAVEPSRPNELTSLDTLILYKCRGPAAHSVASYADRRDYEIMKRCGSDDCGDESGNHHLYGGDL